MRKIFSLLAIVVSALIFVSCGESDNEPKLSTFTVQITSDQTITDFTAFQVKVTESKSGTAFTAQADASGKATFSLPLGQYDIVAEDSYDGVSTMYGHTENYTLSAYQATVSVKVAGLFGQLEKTFVLDELYFNGDDNGNFSRTYYEGYFTIRNVSDRALYADGLSIAICGDYNNLEYDESDPMPSYLKKDSIVVTQLYTIPGNGHTYKVNPGESIVIAHSAINHKLGADGKVDPEKPYSIDLSGADFEIYVPYEYSMTTDNQDVPNLIVDYSMNQAFNWGYSGGTPMLLVRLTDAQKTAMLNGKVKLPLPTSSSMEMDHLLLPMSAVIDGAETGCVDNLFHKVLPDRIDRGSVLIQDDGLYGGFCGQFVQRKRVTDASGKETVVDTNNSTDDFEIIPHGQKSYPKK